MWKAFKYIGNYYDWNGAPYKLAQTQNLLIRQLFQNHSNRISLESSFSPEKSSTSFTSISHSHAELLPIKHAYIFTWKSTNTYRGDCLWGTFSSISNPSGTLDMFPGWYYITKHDCCLDLESKIFAKNVHHFMGPCTVVTVVMRFTILYIPQFVLLASTLQAWCSLCEDLVVGKEYYSLADAMKYSNIDQMLSVSLCEDRLDDVRLPSLF